MPSQSDKSIRLCGVAVSLLLSYLAFAFHTMIARDSVLYVQAAQEFLDKGLTGTMDVFTWPFYSILFALVHKFSGIPLEISARIIDAVLIALLVDSFVRLYQETFPDTTIKWIPVAVILAYTGLNDYRYEMVRDWGFLAFSVLSFVYLLRAYKSSSVINSLRWQLFIIIAFLFRIEAVAFMVLAPLIFLFRHGSMQNRLVNFATSNALFLFLIIGLMGTIFLFDIALSHLGRVSDIIAYLNFSKSIQMVTQYSEQIKTTVMPYHGSENSMILLLTGVFGLLIFKTLTKLGLFYNGVLLLGYYRFRLSETSANSAVVAYLAAIAFFIVYVFVSHYMVLAGRYLLLTTILILIFVSYFFERLVASWTDSKKPFAVALLKTLLVVNLATGLYHTPSTKEYIKKLGEWNSQNIAGSAPFISNNRRLYYYSGRKIPYKRFRGGLLKPEVVTPTLLAETDYVALRVKFGNPEFNALINSEQVRKIKEFCNLKGDCATVYQTKGSNKVSN